VDAVTVVGGADTAAELGPTVGVCSAELEPCWALLGRLAGPLEDSTAQFRQLRQPSTDQRGSTTMGTSAKSEGDVVMSVYRVIDVIGTSSSSWEEAAAEAITAAGESVRLIRVAEVTKQDIVVGDAGDLLYRTKIQLSFKYESE
jgi:flavin-binding protein dodecin